MTIDTARELDAGARPVDPTDPTGSSGGSVPRPSAAPPLRTLAVSSGLASLAAVVLTVALGWIAYGSGLVTSDEGALLGQIHLVRDHGTWSMPHPVRELDPDGRWFPVDQAQLGNDGWSPLAKHPLTTTILGWAYGPWGVGGAVGLGIAAAAGIVLSIGHIARRFGARTGALAMVAAAVCSPLVYDSSVLMGHPFGTLSAALVSVAALAVLQHRVGDDRDAGPVSPRRVGACSLLGFLAAGLGPLVRNETMLFAAAVALALVVMALRRRSIAPACVGAAVGIGGIVGYLADTAWAAAVVGTARPFRIVDDAGLVGRAAGAVSALVLPGDGGLGVGAVVAAGLLGAVLVGRSLRATSRATSPLIIGLVLLAGAAVVWPFVASGSLTPGLLVACPVLVVGFLLIPTPASDLERFAILTVGLCTAAILATQYPDGGGLQWGGRYLHVVLPLVIPLAAIALGAALGRQSVTVRRATAAVLVVAVVGNLIALVLATHNVRDLNLASVESVRAFADRQRPGGGDRPIVVSDVTPLGRLSWDGLPDERQLYVPEDEWRTFGRQLAASDVDRIVVATTRSANEITTALAIPVTVAADELNDVGTLRLLVVEVQRT